MACVSSSTALAERISGYTALFLAIMLVLSCCESSDQSEFAVRMVQMQFNKPCDEIYVVGELPSTSYSKPVYRIGGISYARRGGPGFKVTNDKGLEFSLSGLVKSETFWDTRQLNSSRAGDYVNFPLDVDIGANGKDIKDRRAHV